MIKGNSLWIIGCFSFVDLIIDFNNFEELLAIWNIFCIYIKQKYMNKKQILHIF